MAAIRPDAQDEGVAYRHLTPYRMALVLLHSLEHRRAVTWSAFMDGAHSDPRVWRNKAGLIHHWNRLDIAVILAGKLCALLDEHLEGEAERE